MSKILALLAVAPLLSFGQFSQGVLTVLVDPTIAPQSCNANSPVEQFNGNLYACKSGSYALTSGGGGATTPATTLVLKGTGITNGVAAATPGTDYFSWAAGPVIYAASYGAVCDPGNNSTDSTNAIIAAVNWTIANNNGGVPTIYLPNCRVVVGARMPFLGVTSLRVIGGPNTVWINKAASDFNFSTGPGYFFYQPRGYPVPSGTSDISSVPITTVAAQATVVTAITPSLVSTWQAGDQCLLTGQDQQGNGFPPNYRYFETCTIQSVNTGTGAVTLNAPIANTYNQNWYSVNTISNPSGIKDLSKTGVSGGVSQLYLTTYLYFESIDFSQGAVGGGFYSDTYAGGFYTEFNKCKFYNFVPSNATTVVVRNSTLAGIEGDKEVNTFRLIDSTVGPGAATAGVAISAGTGINNAIFDNVSFLGDVYWSAKKTTYNDCHFTTPGGYPWFISDYNGDYTQSLTVNNPIYISTGQSEQIALGGTTATVVATPTSTTFTVSSGDWAALISTTGIGSNIYNSSTGALIATIADMYVNPSGGAFTISTVAAHGMSASQTFKIKSTQSASVRNPLLTTGDISSLPTYATAGTLPQYQPDQNGAGLTSFTSPNGTIAIGGTLTAPTADCVAGVSGALTCVGPGVDIVTSVVPTKAAANTFTGVDIFNQLRLTTTAFASLPVACNSGTDGQLARINDALSQAYAAVVTVGGGSLRATLMCDGSIPNWTVMGH